MVEVVSRDGYVVEMPKTIKECVLFDLDQMRASGSWDVPTLTRAIEIFQGLRDIWQPIETAPKNKLLLVGFFNGLGKWRSMHAQYRDDLPQHDYADDDDEPAPAGWYEGSLEAEMLFPVSPTHWMPLPEPPQR